MMTTANRSESRVAGVDVGSPRPGVRLGILGKVAIIALLAGLATVALGALVDGRDGALGALVGAGTVVSVLAVGCGSLSLVAKVQPAATLLVALVGYLAQAALMVLVFVRLSEVSLFADGPGRVWLALGLVAGTLAWLTAQLVLTVRQRVPYYELTGGQQ